MQRFAGKPTKTPAAFLFGDVQAPHACAGNHGLDRDPCLFEAGSGRLSGTALRQLRTRRPHLLQLIGYLMLHLPGRLDDAWRSRAIRYNHMLKDFRNAPVGYERMVSRFGN